MKKESETKIFNLFNIGIAIAIIIIIGSIFFLSYKKDCNTDQECFVKEAKICNPAKLSLLKDDNSYYYEITNSLTKECKFAITLTKVSDSNQEAKQLLEGKTMYCTVPKEGIDKFDIIKNENVIDYCTGPLKEGIYELIIRRLYGNLARNVGPVLNQISNQST